MKKELDNVCNWCLLQKVKAEAKEQGLVTRLRQSQLPLGGVDVYVTPEGLSNNEMVDPANCKKYFRGWFQSTPDHCVC